jgi:hypothetical protein
VHVTFGKAAANPRKIKNRRLFSPEIFSAGFGVFPLPRVDQAAHLLSANLFACAGAAANPGNNKKTSTLNKDGLNLLFRSTTNGGFMFTAGITNMGAPGLAH